MREITNKAKEEADKEIERRYREESGLKFSLGKHEIKIPRKIISALEEKIRVYEVEDIEDLERNYDVLSKTSSVPPCIWFFGLRIFPLYIIDKDLRHSLGDKSRDELRRLTQMDASEMSLKVNYNVTLIENVYLGNFDFIKRKSFEACEFDIRDRCNKVIRGLFVYHHIPPEGEDDRKKKELGKALAASEAVTFDLQSIALSEYYMTKRNGIYMPRGKKLWVQSIYRRGKSEEPIDIPHDEKPTEIPSDILIRTPILIGV